jgi:hypothetical protein
MDCTENPSITTKAIIKREGNVSLNEKGSLTRLDLVACFHGRGEEESDVIAILVDM